MKFTIISVLIAAVFIVGALVFSSDKGDVNNIKANNVSVVEGQQIISLVAKAGFSPKTSVANAGIPTILRLNTSGTFDCSAIVRIPKLSILQNLPLTGVTDIDIGTPQKGTISGTCGMGMYPFELVFN
jgi:plastocyanin domain-containing protein